MPSDLIRGWKPVRVKKTRQIRIIEPRFDSIETRLKGNKKAGAIISHRLCLIC